MSRCSARVVMLTIMVMSVMSKTVAGQSAGIREVSASETSLVTLQTRMLHTTTIVLPEDEVIAYPTCGDPGMWVIDIVENRAHVRPAKKGASTDIKLITTRGEMYVFLLAEKEGPGVPDVVVNVKRDPNRPLPAIKYVNSAEVELVRGQLADAKEALKASEQRAEEAIVTYRQEYPRRLKFVYGTPKYERPFLVRSMWHDGQFTYVKSEATELPALYEVKDGKPAVVNFQVQNGVYVVPKVLDRGYLALGNERFPFAQQGGER